MLSIQLGSLVTERTQGWFAQKFPVALAQIVALGVSENLARGCLAQVERIHVRSDGRLTIKLFIEWTGCSFDDVGGEEVSAKIEATLDEDCFIGVIEIPEAVLDPRYKGVWMLGSEAADPQPTES